MSGELFIVATPIGNYDDMSARAVETLRGVELIAVEDSRHSGRLLKHFAINTRTQALHDHNEKDMAPKLVEKLLGGLNLALISDAGTPLISDPGYKLVQLAQQAGIRVIPIPGPAAFVAALSASGLATDKFTFEGFLAPKTGARRRQLENYLNESRTLIFYEAPHRIEKCLVDMCEVFGEQHIAVLARELTKTFETIRQAPLGELVAWVKSDPNQQKGEIVIIVDGFKATTHEAGNDNRLSDESERVLNLLLAELSLKQAVKLTVDICGDKKKAVYQRALELKDK